MFVDPTIRSREDTLRPDSILLGWTAHDEAALPLHRVYHNGSYAEQVRVPMENVTPSVTSTRQTWAGGVL